MVFKSSFFVVVLWILWGCRTDPVPKPEAMLRLEYSKPHYESYKKAGKYQFEKNKMAKISAGEDKMENLEYPEMKATLFMTYKQVDNNINQLLADTQKLVYEHIVKADAITEQPYVNASSKVYGMLYEIRGNAASQVQFYATDSTRHFLTGSLYFYAKPNYDSVFPAVVYLKKDIRRLVESLHWEGYD